MVYDYKTCAIIRDRETGEIVFRLAEGCYNYSIYQEKDTVYVLGTKSEEWVMCNTFYNWKDFELTPYGKIKLDFLNIIKKVSKRENRYTIHADCGCSAERLIRHSGT